MTSVNDPQSRAASTPPGDTLASAIQREEADDFEIEVGDLREDAALTPTEGDEQPAPADDVRLPALPVHGAPLRGRSPFAARPHARRRRALAGASVALAITLTLASLIVMSAPNPGAALGTLLRLPTPTATPVLQLGDDQVVVARGVYWGRLTIDGRVVATSALSTQPLQLARGAHTIGYQAQFFPTLRCRLSVPAARDDTCPLLAQSAIDTPSSTFGQTRILDLQATVNRLPAAQSQRLLAAFAVALAGLTRTGAIAQGEQYVTASGQVATATAPLTATLIPSVAASRHLYHAGQPNATQVEDACDPLCDFQGSFGVDLQSWPLATYLYTAWRYMLPNGQTIIAPRPALPLGQRILPFFAWWDAAGWHVSLSPLIEGDVECALGQQQLAQLAVQTNVSGVALEPLPAADVTQGCLLLYQPPSATQPLSAAAQVLYRYGVLLAANTVARQLFPSVGATDAAETATARRLAAELQPTPSGVSLTPVANAS